MLAIMLMVGFFIMCAIRMVPVYLEYLSVKDIIARIAMETDPAVEGVGDIRRKVDKRFNTNQIYKLKFKEVEVYSRSGKTYIDADYEVRLPVMGIIDSVLKFEDLLYEVGNPKPLPKPPVPQK
mgnify:CR=1 FL=1